MKESPPQRKSHTTNKKIGHIVSHTHWDREWRYTIWETQLMLIDFMDELIDVLESGKYYGFLMDGQVVPVLDYLEARPEMMDRVKKLVSSGKLHVGPWYCLPDEYPVDGEALVRNLLIGQRRAKELGAVFNVGYTSFGWGQTAQLPQIYAGFGMDVSFIGKLVNKQRAPQSEFLWRAPDGSELLASRFGEMGRQNFYFKINLTALYGLDHSTWDWKYHWDKHGILFHRADREQMEQDHFRIDAPTQLHLNEITPQIAEETWQTTDDSVLENDRLMMNGCDYAASQPQLAAMIEKLKAVDPDKNREWIQTNMLEFIEIMKQKIDQSKLKIVEGELRDGPIGSLTGNAQATRLYLKQLNKHAQNMLIRFAEPLSIITNMLGTPWPKNFIDKAWDYLLKSHPHDSINGVTQDKTANDVYHRLEQVVDISQTLGNRAMQELVKQIDLNRFEKDDILLVVFNPLPYARKEVTEAWITFPNDLNVATSWNDDMGFLHIYDAEGNAVGTQWEGSEDVSYCVAELHARILPFYAKRHRLFFETGKIPAMGYKVFRIGQGEEIRPDNISWAENQARTGSLLKSPHLMENKYLVVEMNPNGTFNLTDKENQKTYFNLNYYEDRGEHGTYWINWRPMFQKTYSSLGCSAKIWSEETGPLQSTLVSEITMQLPLRGHKEQQRRGDEKADFTIRTAITLRTNARQVEVNVEFENRHEDHYLRSMFPTGLKETNFADAGGHFFVDCRTIQAPGPKPGSEWLDMGTLPQNNFVDVSDGKLGIAFINDSLTEYEVFRDDERTVALSLLRAVKTWIVTGHVGSDFPSQKGGQCFGKHKIRYAIRPHAGNWQEANIPLEAELFNVPLRPVETNAHKGTLNSNQLSFFEITNSILRFSALKKAEDRDTFIVRIYNPTSQTQKGKLIFFKPIQKAWITNLNEEQEQELKIVKDNEVDFTVASYKIITIEINGNGINFGDY